MKQQKRKTTVATPATRLQKTRTVKKISKKEALGQIDKSASDLADLFETGWSRMPADVAEEKFKAASEFCQQQPAKRKRLH
jgi:hypothetical protein